MNFRKHFGAIAMAVLMVLSFGALPAFAVAQPASTGSLTMLDESGAQKTTSSYSADQIVKFDASVLNGKTVYTNMKLNPDYKSTMVQNLGLAGGASDSDVLNALSSLDEKNDAAKISALAVALKSVKPSTSGFTNTTTSNGKFSSLPYGYYLVLETANNADDGTVLSKPILVGVPVKGAATVTPDVTVTVKTDKATVEKKIVVPDPSDGSKNILVDSSTAAVGDTVRYQSLSTIPTYSADASGITYNVTDTFSKGLTYQGIDAVKIVEDNNGSYTEKKTLASGTDYTLSTDNLGGATFRLSLSNDQEIKNWGNAGYKLLVTYHAVLNSSANSGSVGNPNSIHLTYSNNPGETDRTTPDDTVITYTNRLVVTKKDSGGATLSGATFELHRQNGKDASGNPVWGDPVDTQITDGSGLATFSKLQQGTYELVETKAPDGYNLSDPVIFTVNAKNGGVQIPDANIAVTQVGNAAALDFKAVWSCDNNNVSIDGTTGNLNLGITDTKGFVLPGTGGIGTTIFTVCGIGIIALGCCLALVYNRKKKKSGQH